MKMDQKTPAAFPLATYEPDVSGEVERCIEKAVMDLLSQCVFSGIMITYAAPGFPLYYIDERMLALLDYSSQAELIAANGQAMINCIRPEDRMGRQAEIAQALLNGTCYTTTYRTMCRDRGHIWVKETGVQRQLSNGASVLVSLCLDITGQIEAQAELESIVQCPIGGIFRARMDRDFTLIYANDHYYTLYGLTREDLRNRFNNKMIRLVHPGDIHWMKRRLKKAVEQREDTLSLEYRAIRPDGKTVWLLMNGSLSEHRGNMLLTGMVIDISHQKFMEDRLCCKSRRQRALCVKNRGPVD